MKEPFAYEGRIRVVRSEVIYLLDHPEGDNAPTLADAIEDWQAPASPGRFRITVEEVPSDEVEDNPDSPAGPVNSGD